MNLSEEKWALVPKIRAHWENFPRGKLQSDILVLFKYPRTTENKWRDLTNIFNFSDMSSYTYKEDLSSDSSWFFLTDISSQSKYNDYQYVLKFVCVVWKKKRGQYLINYILIFIFPGNSITRIEANLQNAQKSLQKLKFCILNNLGFLWGFKILWQQVIAN